MLSRLSFQGRGCIVTGGTKGIGRAVAQQLDALGAAVVTCSRGGDADAQGLPDSVKVCCNDTMEDGGGGLYVVHIFMCTMLLGVCRHELWPQDICC